MERPPVEVRRLQRKLAAANAVGGAAVFIGALVFAPGAKRPSPGTVAVLLGTFALYVPLAVAGAMLWGAGRTRAALAAADPLMPVLRLPTRLAAAWLATWTVGGVVFGALATVL